MHLHRVELSRLIASVWRSLNLRGDPATEAGRAQERKRRVLLSALAAGGAKAVSLLSLLITVPLTLGYLGPERYGLWMAIASLLGVLSFADLGLGFGLVNVLSSAEGLGDVTTSRRAVSNAFFMLVAVSVVLAVALIVSWQHLHWGVLLNARSEATRAEVGTAMAVFLACFLAGLPLSVVNHGFAALQQGFRSSLYQGLGSLLGLAAILAVVKARGGLDWLVLGASGAPLVAGLLGAWDLYVRRRPDLRPRLEHASRQGALEVARLGGLFFVIQVAITVAFQADGLVLARILGPESVATYAVTQKLFLQVPFVLGYFLTPLWPAYAEALTRGDRAWVRRTLRKSLLLGFAVNVPAAAAIFFAAPFMLAAWVGGAVQPPVLLLLSLAAWAALNSINGPVGMFLNGVGALRYQAIACSLMAVANLALSIFFTRRLGIAGVVLGSIVAQALFSYLPALVYVPRLFKRMERA